jgi:hypothetical protein
MIHSSSAMEDTTGCFFNRIQTQKAARKRSIAGVSGSHLILSLGYRSFITHYIQSRGVLSTSRILLSSDPGSVPMSHIYSHLAMSGMVIKMDSIRAPGVTRPTSNIELESSSGVHWQKSLTFRPSIMD